MLVILSERQIRAPTKDPRVPMLTRQWWRTKRKQSGETRPHRIRGRLWADAMYRVRGEKLYQRPLLRSRRRRSGRVVASAPVCESLITKILTLET
jgi:hypothetical protein